MNLILFGFKSCGKTTIGQKIAKHMGLPFLDTDHLLEELYFSRTGEKMHFRNIFQEVGEERFRSLEEDLLETLKGTEQTIIAVGGGLILNLSNAAFLAELGQLVYLKLSKETLKKRILRTPPAYLDPFNKEKSFEKMYEERLGNYEKIPALQVDLETKTGPQAILDICRFIQKEEIKHGK